MFTGLSAFPITPADAEGRVETDALGRLVERIAAAEVQSVGLLGSTGSYVYLDRAERRRAVAAAAECLAGRVPLVVGAGALRTDAAVALARDAEAAGADAILLAPVSYTPLTDAEVFAHFGAVAGATGLPLCIYNNPSTTHFAFSHALIERLAELPRVAAVKMPLPASGDPGAEIAALRALMPDGFAIGYSGDWGCTEALLAGADAWFSVAAGLFPRQAAALSDAARSGDVATARRLDGHFAPLWDLFRAYGSLRVVHAAVRALGLGDAEPQRPILPLPAAEMDRVRAAIGAVERPA